MSIYLVRMTPLEGFTFGGEKGVAFAGVNKELGGRNVANTSYYQMSQNMPEQTTIIGMLRYLILKNTGLLKPFADYTEEDRKAMSDEIGEKSFSFENTEFQMGKLQAVSPVFIVDDSKEIEKISYYICNPLFDVGKNKYEPIKMTTELFNTSYGTIRLPNAESYNTKTELKTGFLNIGSREEPKMEYVADIFKTDMLTGNRKNEKESDEDAFFKRQTKNFNKEGLAFATFTTCEEDVLPRKEIAYMGLKKSTFLIESIPVEKNDLVERIQNAIKVPEKWYYALSDILPEEASYHSFAIVNKKQIRNLQTDYSQKNFQQAVQRNKKQYNLIEAGSVFFGEIPKLKTNDNLKKAGYNCIIQLGGEE